MALELNKEYELPQISTEQIKIEEILSSYVIFKPDHLVWVGEFYATWLNEENEKLGTTEDTQRYHKWVTYLQRRMLAGAEIYYVHDDSAWRVKIFNSGSGNDIILVFNQEKEATIIFDLFIEYIIGNQ